MSKRAQDSRRRMTVNRMVMVGAAFLIFCVVYIIKLGVLELDPAHIGGHPQDGTTSRTVTISAVRGQIYDRNGKVLVSNRYNYDLVIDYSLFPSEAEARNDALLDAMAVLASTGEGSKFADNGTPFEGTYPHLTYTAAVTDATTKAHKTLVAQIESSGLRTTFINKLRHDGMSRKEAEKAFDADPLHYVDAATLTDYFCEEYGLDSGYANMEIHRLIQVYWGMEVTGFSRVNDYVLASDVSMNVITRAKEQGIPGAAMATRVSRAYAYPGYASHILGQTGPIYAENWEAYKDLGYDMNALVGISGCEAAFENYLHGQDGTLVIVEDADGNVVDQYVDKEPVAGRDVYLTIDIDLQIAAEDGLAENVDYVRNGYGRDQSEAGALTAIDPDTGEVLALASYPSYDLTTFNADYNDLLTASGNPLINRALNGLYAPGSTFKPGMVAAALSEGTVDTSTKLECAGVYTYYAGYQPDCWVYNSVSDSIDRHGWIDAATALEVSCNCYFYEAGRLLGIDRMNEYCHYYGLGLATGIELGESTGSLAGPAYREATHQMAWQATDTIAAAIGQSDNAFSPLQISVYISTLMTGGTRYSAHLLSHVVDVSSGEVIFSSTPTVVSEFDLKESYRAEIVEGMERVISTSWMLSSFMSDVPVTVAAKTGTAQVGGGLDDNGLFTCAAPSKNPEIVVTSVIEHAGGGSYAGLAAARVLEAYYGE